MSVVRCSTFEGDISVDVAIVGSGACGMSAALAASDAGASVLVLERDAAPSGSTALSSGFIPACGTRWQADAGVVDSVEQMSSDIMAKAKHQTDANLVEHVCRESGPALEWLADTHGLSFVLIDGFTYPGHSALRMHAVPERTGRALIDALSTSVQRAGVDVLISATATRLHANPDSRILGLEVERPDGTVEHIACGSLVLACNGFGGNPQMVAEHIPEMREALYFGHAGNRGDAMQWGAELGASLVDMSGYQGHGSVATPHGVLITWALMMEGAIQLNARGMRFSNEHQGYSEQSVAVLGQPDRIAYNVYDERLYRLGQGFADFRDAETAGAVRVARGAAELASIIGADMTTVESTLSDCVTFADGERADPFGRNFTAAPALQPPYYITKVTGALFHTQGGLAIDKHAAVLSTDGTSFPNLYAGGGAARGVSGPAVWGYLSGNGLLTAITFGRIAGNSAARFA